MAKWDFTTWDRGFLVVVLFGSVFLGGATLKHLWHRAHWSDGEREQVIRITGIDVPSDGADDHLVFSGDTVFTVSERALHSRGNENPWFLFGIGKEYRVKTRGEERHSLFGVIHPEILQSEEISGRHDTHISFSR